MSRFILIRIIASILIIFAIVSLSFFMLRLVPGDPISGLVGDFPAPPEYVERLRHSFGLDRSLLEQYLLYMGHVLRGDLGYSFVNQQPVADLLLERSLRTLLLMLPALVISSLLGILLGLLSIARPDSWLDGLVSAFSLWGYSVPVFWFGQILIIVFAVRLGLLPAQGMSTPWASYSGFWDRLWDYVSHMILPSFAIILYYMGIVARVARASLREVIGNDYIVTAYAKGLSARAVRRNHVLPNAMVPIASVIGYNFGSALTGTIMTEAVFAWPGLGGLFTVSIPSRDYPVLQGIFLLSAASVVVVNLLTDIVYGLIDPRIREVNAHA